MIPPSHESVLYDPSQWTALSNAVSSEVLPQLSSTAMAVTYLVLYDKVSHRKNRAAAATLTDLAQLTGFDARTVKASLFKLIEGGFIDFDKRGTNRSRTDKTRWTVPLADFDWADGKWTPIPRFLVRRYLPVFPGALLLPLLIRFQQMSWQNKCWPSVATLAQLTNRSERWVYLALHEMGNRHFWSRLGTGLPWPLEISYVAKDGKERHYYRVRAVCYRKGRSNGSPTVSLSREFADFFAPASIAKLPAGKGGN